MTLIINADDFGSNQQNNKAVVQSFKNGLCSSATLMPNTPGFEEACELSHKNRLLDHIGIHLVLTGGPPLTEKIKAFSRLCDKRGELCMGYFRPIFKLPSSEREVIADEIRAQIKRCRDKGIPITHADSHEHIHTEWAVVVLLTQILRQEGIRYLRVARNSTSKIIFPKKVYKKMANYVIRSAGMAKTRYFGSIDNFLCLKRRIGSSEAFASSEIMIHPVFDEKGNLIDQTTKKILSKAIKGIDSYRDAVSFTEAKYS